MKANPIFYYDFSLIDVRWLLRLISFLWLSRPFIVASAFSLKYIFFRTAVSTRYYPKGDE
ncbi:hypothetical protein KFK09_006892 [Dendrobium nobile]|uniref:Uncharacterized protein n=1 Tax=Dendrobium nobile TaxID=94219 RepID=A0A8T3BVN1_DENNO|nr:hypothetical protein KFK09_006892 [Dendrobium nobile]